jgi:hypothetical protein
MNNRQMNQYDMFLRVQKVLQGYQQVWGSNTRFSANYQELSALLLQIDALELKKTSSSIAITQSKEVLKLKLLELAVRIVKGAGSYAADVQHLPLAAQVDYSRTALLKMRESQMLSTCIHIAESVQPHVAVLSEYGITQALLDEFKQHGVAYKQIQPESQLAISQNKAATEEMAQVFPAISRLLKDQLDGKMAQYAETHADFYQAYFSARAIIERGKGIKPEETLAGQ